jgi:TPR repeat protein
MSGVVAGERRRRPRALALCAAVVAALASCAATEGTAGGAGRLGGSCAAGGTDAQCAGVAGAAAVEVAPRELCLFERAEVRWEASVPRLAGMLAARGLAVLDADSGALVQLVALDGAVDTSSGAAVSGLSERWAAQQEAVRAAFESYDATVPAVGPHVVAAEWEPLAGDAALPQGPGAPPGPDAPGAFPRIVRGSTSPGYGPGSTLTFVFDRDTDEPPVESDSEVRRVVELSASVGRELSGRWADPRTLVVTVVDDAGRVDYHDESVGLTAHIARRARLPHERRLASLEELHAADLGARRLRGSLTLRLAFSGRFVLALLVLDGERPVARSEPLRVADCEPRGQGGAAVAAGSPAVLVQRRLLVADVPAQRPPVWSMPGVVALHGSKLVLPRITASGAAAPWFEPFGPAEWTLSFWIALAETPADAQEQQRHRALLYHGPGRGHESGFRTPSIWLLAGSNRLGLRVSTVNTDDSGTDSASALPTDRWVHVALVVRNATALAGAGVGAGAADVGAAQGAGDGDDGAAYAGQRFDARVFVDGEQWIVVKAESKRGERALVVNGPGRLHLFHDPWGPGPRGFAAAMAMHDRALSRLELHQAMQAEARFFPEARRACRQLLETRPESADAAVAGPDPGSARESDPELNAELVAEAGALATGSRERRALLSAAAADLSSQAMAQLAEEDGDQRMLQRAAASANAEAAYSLAMLPEVAAVVEPRGAGGTRSGDRDRFLERLEVAALHGSLRAALVLAHEHRLAGNCRESVFYMAQLAAAAREEHDARGQQPLLEMQTLSDWVPEQGERGEDDEHIQYQLLRAEQDDAEAQLAMGGLLYWGARGLQRDQARAFRLFERAAAQGLRGAQTAAGNLLLKGEGVEMNRTRARGYYEAAAAQDDTEALNGLGFLYFFGDEQAGVSKNVSKALELFLRNLRDGDSHFNAAHILLHDSDLRDVAEATRLLRAGASTFASFSCAHALGELLMSLSTEHGGRGAECHEVQRFLRAAALRGSWARVLREGFDAFLARDMATSARRYTEAALMGYSRGAENAAWLLRSELQAAAAAAPSSLVLPAAARTLFSRMDRPLPPLQRLAQGDLRLAVGRERDAVRSWAQACAEGDPAFQRVYRAQASHNLGVLAAHKGLWPRADKYFARARRFVEGDDSEPANAARLALNLAEWRLKARKSLPPWLAEWVA